MADPDEDPVVKDDDGNETDVSEWEGYIINDTIEDCLLREWKENQLYLGYSPYSDEELEEQAPPGEVERIISRSDVVMERYLGVLHNKPEYKLACARDTVERELLDQQFDIPEYDGGNVDYTYSPDWIPEFNPDGWVGDVPTSISIGGGAVMLRITKLLSGLVEVFFSKDNGSFIRYTFGIKKKAWCSVATSKSRNKGVYIPFSTDHFWLDILNQDGSGIAILNAYRKQFGSKEYWELKMSSLTKVLTILIGAGGDGCAYANLRSENK